MSACIDGASALGPAAPRLATLWDGQGIPAREIAERVGHTRPSISLDIYTHVMPLDEVPVESYGRLLAWSPCGPEQPLEFVFPANRVVGITSLA